MAFGVFYFFRLGDDLPKLKFDMVLLKDSYYLGWKDDMLEPLKN